MLASYRIIASLLLCFTPLAAQADDGDFVWARGMGGADNDLGSGIAVDDAGNVYTVGTFSGKADFDPGTGVVRLTSAGYEDIFVQKLDASGNLVWARRMGGELPNANDRGWGVAVDRTGNVYTTGSFSGIVDFDPGVGTVNLTSAGYDNIFVQKLDASGNFVWARVMGGNGALYGTNIGFCVAVDNAGNVYTAGSFSGTADFDPGVGTVNLTSAWYEDIFVQKLDANGNLVWARSVGGTGVFDAGRGIAVDSAGNVYTTGYFEGTADFDPGADTVNLTSAAGSNDIFVQKLDTSGDFVWARRMGGADGDGGSGIAVDSVGNVYTTGSFSGTVDFDPGAGTVNLTSRGKKDIFLQKLDANGNLIWARRMGGADGDGGSGIAVDSVGNIYTTGGFRGTVDFDPGASAVNLTSAGSADIFVQKLDASGSLVWAQRMGGTDSESGIGVAVDRAGNVYTTGAFRGTVDFDPGVGTVNLRGRWEADIFVQKLSGPESIPPNATSIAPFTTGPTNADNVLFTVTFDEDVRSFNDAADIVITHNGTTSSGATISGGPLVYTVDVMGITGNGSFTLAVNTASDVQDLAGNPLATSVTSAAVIVDNAGPVFGTVVANPAEVSAGDTVSISFDSSEPVAGDPEVKVNGNPATRLAKADFAYEYTVQSRDVLGAATITISGVDALGNVGAFGDSTLLDIVRAEGEGNVEGEGVPDGEGAGAVEGTQDGEGEGVVEGAEEGEGEGENPPVGCGGCNPTGGPIEKSLGDWLAAFLGVAVVLGAHVSLRSRLET